MAASGRRDGQINGGSNCKFAGSESAWYVKGDNHNSMSAATELNPTWLSQSGSDDSRLELTHRSQSLAVTEEIRKLERRRRNPVVVAANQNWRCRS